MDVHMCVCVYSECISDISMIYLSLHINIACPGGLMVKILGSHRCNPGLIPGQRTAPPICWF